MLQSPHDRPRRKLYPRLALGVLPFAGLVALVGGLLGRVVLARVWEAHEPETWHAPLAPSVVLAAGWTGALIGLIVAVLGLCSLRARQLARASFEFDPDALRVSWPGHSRRVAWSEVERIERRGEALLLRLQRRGAGRIWLFGLGDPDQVEALVRARTARVGDPLRSRRAA